MSDVRNHAEHESANLGAVGHVKMTSSLRGVMLKKHNLVVDSSVEVMLQALMGRDLIDTILFGDSGGAAVTPGLKSIFNPVFRATAGTSSSIPPVISKDNRGLSSVGTWTAVYTNPGPSTATYDMLGLVTQNSRLFAATSFPSVSLAAGESIAVEWTILLAGR
jgi:hypothetical protein